MFVSFEGLDGSGKTSQIRALATYLESAGYIVFSTREPGGTAIGNSIRAILHDLKNTEMHPHTELLLYVASRAQLVEQIIRPYLQSGAIILCDRFADSTIAYQGYGHGLDLDTLRTIVDFATGGLRPDLTFYLDINAQDGLLRRQKAAAEGAEWNRLDAFALEFHQRVRLGYQDLIDAEPDRWVVINAQADFNNIQDQIRETLLARLR